MVEKLIAGRKHVIRVRVGVERPNGWKRSYVRRAPDIKDDGVLAGAISGALFARRKSYPDRFGIKIEEISGDLESSDSSFGAAAAAAVATWIAFGSDWDDADLLDTHGWSVRREPSTVL